MKRLLDTFVVFFLMAVVVTACKEDEETSLSSDCYISDFTLGGLRRDIHVTDSTGKDSSYVVGFSGSYYPLNIDQLNQTILLQTPLPSGTRLKTITANVSFTGVLVYRPWDVTSAADSIWRTFNSTDSIDYSEPLRFRVYATDGSSYKDYYMRLECRTNDPSAYTWECWIPNGFVPSDVQCKMMAWDSTFFFMWHDVNTYECDWHYSVHFDFHYPYSAEHNPLITWWQGNTGVWPDDYEFMKADCRTLQRYKDTLWVSGYDGRSLWINPEVYGLFERYVTFDESSDLTTLRLFAGTDHALYGLGTAADGTRGIYSSTDGRNWTLMELDDDMALFPTEPVAVAYKQDIGNSRILVVGPAEGGSPDVCEVWSLLEGEDEPWTYFPPAPDNPFRLPAMEDLNIFSYSSFLIAMGGASADGTKAALSQSYVSYDNGITWEKDKQLVVPEELQGTPLHVAATAYEGNIWLRVGSALWHGRLNSYEELQ